MQKNSVLREFAGRRDFAFGTTSGGIYFAKEELESRRDQAGSAANVREGKPPLARDRRRVESREAFARVADTAGFDERITFFEEP